MNTIQTSNIDSQNIAKKRNRNERGEGVISLAIAVLIMAVIGAVLYANFRTTADKTSQTADEKIASIK